MTPNSMKTLTELIPELHAVFNEIQSEFESLANKKSLFTKIKNFFGIN